MIMPSLKNQIIDKINKTFGLQAEEKSNKYLKSKGFKILDRNFRHKRAEIDIIAIKENVLIFVEVKARSKIKYGRPESFVSETKKKLFFEAAEEYILKIDWTQNIRFDIISITKIEKNIELIHFEDAFY